MARANRDKAHISVAVAGGDFSIESG